MYFGQLRPGTENQQTQINKRIRMSWVAVGRLGYVLKNPDKSALQITILKVTAVERIMLGILLRNRIINEEKRRTKIKDVIKCITSLKWT